MKFSSVPIKKSPWLNRCGGKIWAARLIAVSFTILFLFLSFVSPINPPLERNKLANIQGGGKVAKTDPGFQKNMENIQGQNREGKSQASQVSSVSNAGGIYVPPPKKHVEKTAKHVTKKPNVSVPKPKIAQDIRKGKSEESPEEPKSYALGSRPNGPTFTSLDSKTKERIGVAKITLDIQGAATLHEAAKAIGAVPFSELPKNLSLYTVQVTGESKLFGYDLETAGGESGRVLVPASIQTMILDRIAAESYSNLLQDPLANLIAARVVFDKTGKIQKVSVEII